MSRKPPGPKTEQRIIGRVQEVDAGNAVVTPTLAADLDRLFDAHRGRLHALALRMLGDESRAEEVVQEALLVAYAKLPDYRGQARFSTWIYGITRNLCLNSRRKRSELLGDDGILDPMSPELDALAALRKQERAALLTRATASLSELEQEAIYLRYVEGESQQQITEILQLPGTGARGLLQRCRRHLRRELATLLEEAGHGSSFFGED